MFTSAIAAVVLAGAIAMPPMVENPYAGVHGDWAPLKAAYVSCQAHSVSGFSAYICSLKVHAEATTNMKRA